MSRVTYIGFLLAGAPLVGWQAEAFRNACSKVRGGVSPTSTILEPVVFLVGMFLIAVFVASRQCRYIGISPWWALPITGVSFGFSAGLLVFRVGAFWISQLVYFLPQLLLVFVGRKTHHSHQGPLKDRTTEQP